jgi:SAM-dependent methyltransferase
MRDRVELFLISVLVLFLELACIRWFPAHVLFLSFFTNTVLLACFLGMSVGCLAAGRRWNYLVLTPVLLVLALGAATWVEWERQRSGSIVDVGNQASAQLVFFGVEYQSTDPSRFVVPIEAIAGLLFILIALVMTGPGQQLGRSLARISNRVEAYTVNIAGSIAGILLFTACSQWQLAPGWWFGGVMAAIAYFLLPEHRLRAVMLAVTPVAVLLLTSLDVPFVLQPQGGGQEIWSPYYRINYSPESRSIKVNLIGHQSMVSREVFSPAYALPHLLNRDSGRPPFSDVLVIGAGSGNDVSRALAWGATRVDAVEIDPVIYGLGLRDHPDAPYSDPRVFIHLDDGRNYLRSTDKQYDLIVYALVDSLVLHSSYSNIRLESYLFTTQAFADIRKRLKPGGLFVMYNYFRQGWIVSRLEGMLEATFGAGNPLAFNLPTRDTLVPDDVLFGEFTVLFAGATAPMKETFARQREYWLASTRPSDVATPNGFEAPDAAVRAAWTAQAPAARAGWLQFRPTLVARATKLKLASDAWPFLYLQRPMIPSLSLRGMAIMGTIGGLFVLPFVRRRAPGEAAAADLASGAGFLAQMFFLGAGFMLIETKAVVHMALLFGGTWVVNSIVFCAVLVMILVANLFVLAVRPRSLMPFYAGLVLSLIVSALVPLDAFLGMSREVQLAGSCLLAFTPIFFAGVVFAVSFSHAADADRAFGANVAGAMFGGLCEYSSMLIGFQYVVLVAAAFYLLSAVGAVRPFAGVERDGR